MVSPTFPWSDYVMKSYGGRTFLQARRFYTKKGPDVPDHKAGSRIIPTQERLSLALFSLHDKWPMDEMQRTID